MADHDLFGRFVKRTVTVPQLISLVAGLAPQARQLAAIFGDGPIDPALREALAIAVSRVNACRYCSFVHHEWAVHVGLDADTLAAVEGGERARLDATARAAVAYAETLAEAGADAVPAELEQEVVARFGARGRDDIHAVVAAMTAMNVVGNTFDALLSRLEGAPAADSRLADELAIAVGYLAVWPAFALLLAAWRRESPLGVATRAWRFLRGFDAR